ncbi:MAG: carbohydrate ABC transporter permease [Anaeroplasma bactoclasticum]|nr:carbohydrate ABC transporter permease [Anaeroplasma bactoclasticum]
MKHLKFKTEGLLNFSDYKKTRYKIVYGIIIFLLVVFVLTAIVPVLWLFITSFKTVNEINSNEYHLFPKAFDLMKLVNLWNRLDFGRYYVNTILVVIGAMICSVIFNGLLAYAIGVLKPAGYKIINGLILFSYMIPAALSLFPLVMQIRDFGMINSYLPLCLIFGSNAYYFMLFKDYFQKIPSSLIEAARMDGLSDFRIFYKVVLPLSKPIIGVVAIFAMTAAYSDFLLPYLILQDDGMKTVMVAIYNLSSTTTIDTSEFLMLLVISIIPQIIIFIIFQKQIMGSQVSSGMKE